MLIIAIIMQLCNSTAPRVYENSLISFWELQESIEPDQVALDKAYLLPVLSLLPHIILLVLDLAFLDLWSMQVFWTTNWVAVLAMDSSAESSWHDIHYNNIIVGAPSHNNKPSYISSPSSWD